MQQCNIFPRAVSQSDKTFPGMRSSTWGATRKMLTNMKDSRLFAPALGGGGGGDIRRYWLISVGEWS